MKFSPKDPPRTFSTGGDAAVTLSDCGDLALAADEQVTLTTPSGGRWDVARKSWGFYATPSLEGRLVDSGLRAVLARSQTSGRHFILLVEKGAEADFQTYLRDQAMIVVCRLDRGDGLAAMVSPPGPVIS